MDTVYTVLYGVPKVSCRLHRLTHRRKGPGWGLAGDWRQDGEKTVRPLAYLHTYSVHTYRYLQSTVPILSVRMYVDQPNC